MTLASDMKRVKRETAAMVQRRPLILEIGATMLRIRLKGNRTYYDVDIESVFSLAAKKEAERLRAERNAKRKGKR